MLYICAAVNNALDVFVVIGLLAVFHLDFFLGGQSIIALCQPIECSKQGGKK